MKDKLIKLGFSEKEALIYMTLLRIGPAVASTLARLTGIKRTSIYDLTNRLLEDNLIMSFKQGTYTYFVVDDVNKLYLYEKQKAELAKDLVEELQKEKNTGAGIQVSYYKGEEGYREMYENILKTRPKEVCVWMHLDYFLKGIDPKREEQWTKERVQKKIFAKLLIQNTKEGRELQKNDKTNCRETRMLPKETAFQTTCILYDGKIELFDTTGETIGVSIQNPALYQMFKALFEQTWDSSLSHDAKASQAHL